MPLRINDKGLVELDYPEGGGWIPMIALVPTTDGLQVALVPAQHQLLIDLLDRCENLDSIDTELGQIREAMRSGDTLKLDIVNGKLEALRVLLQSKLDNDQVQLAGLGDKIVDYSGVLDAIALKTIDYSALLNSLLARASEIKAASDSKVGHLAGIESSFDWQAPVLLNSGAPLLNAVAGTTVSAAVAVSDQALHLGFQCFFTDPTATAKLAIETRRVAGSSALDNLLLSQVEVQAGSVEAGTGIWMGDDFISTPAYGCTEMRLHVISLSAGNLTVYGREIR